MKSLRGLCPAGQRHFIILAIAALAATAPSAQAGEPAAPAGEPILLDGCEQPDLWTAHPAEGVELRISGDEGFRGRALRLDYRFLGGGGWAIARREIGIDLPGNYAFRFRLRGAGPSNTLEFKLIDETGQNVWWSVQHDVDWPADWRPVRIKKRHITFAWGPRGGGEISHVAALELAITASSGGQGTVWIDELELVPLPAASGPVPEPLASGSTARDGHPAAAVLDSDLSTAWTPASGDSAAWLQLDLGQLREYGALTLRWQEDRPARDYVIEIPAEGDALAGGVDTCTGPWEPIYTVTGGNGGRDDLFLGEVESRCLRLRLAPPVAAHTPSLAEITIRSLDWAPDRETFFERLAAGAPRGLYPRGMSGEQAYWTVVGVDDDTREALLSEDGALEVGPGRFSIEPFLTDLEEDGQAGPLVTWADVAVTHSLLDGHLPVPTVTWRHGDVDLEITAFGTGPADSSSVIVRYRLVNRGSVPAFCGLELAIRPFQVDPPTQRLNLQGGTAPIHSIRREGRIITVDDEKGIDGEQEIVCLPRPDVFGASTFAGGEVVADGPPGGTPRPPSYGETQPLPEAVTDPFAAASAMMTWHMTPAPGVNHLPPGGSAEIAVVVPLHPGSLQALGELPAGPGRGGGAAGELSAMSAMEVLNATDARKQWVTGHLAGARVVCRRRMGPVRIELPAAGRPLIESLRAQIGWILVNRAGPAIQPGTRSYARSWIRDGALTCSALLRLGLDGPVRAFLEWYAPHQYPSGKIPCVVDRRGADPVPEHDSSGEFIFLVAETLRYTGDRELASRMWPRVLAAAAYLDSLRHERLTPEYDAPDKREFHGILPPSISHEGYSAKPMHSYWDDFFALRGFRDAAWLAGELGARDKQRRLAAIASEFATDLRRSIEASMNRHGIDYVPGAADLGDFDATSTTIALSPLAVADATPRPALERTFARYWDFFTERRGRADWEAYTPYELRNVGAFVRLGWRERAQELVDFFLGDQRPPGWRQWPEVVRRDPRQPGFLGDLPHTWVGSDYVRSVLDMLAFVDRQRQALVLAAGVPAAWLKDGQQVAVQGLRTPWGPLSYTLGEEQGRLVLDVAAGIAVPPGGLVVRAPRASAGRVAPTETAAAGEIVLREVPARVVVGEGDSGGG
jgi:hypothetical protein